MQNQFQRNPPRLKWHFWLLLTVCIVAACLAAYGSQHPAHSQSATPDSQAPITPAQPQVVARFYGPMPTGVSVSHTGRVFVCFPRWAPHIPFTVGEVVNGHTVAYPDASINAFNREADSSTHLLCVQSIVVDPKNRLWLLDAGDYLFGPALPGGPKLVGVDLATNKVIKIIHFRQMWLTRRHI